MNKKTQQRWHMWRWPLLVGIASAAGLVSALLGDGWLDAMSWMGLGAPIIVVGFFIFRTRQ
jgi:uncharacterized membrane protein YjjP (DUF1212 family)